ncbi:MAG: hypothetical protein EBR87_09065, partial [Cytophagia bacterium]|nr:hypothetical protein [Cytophagia bacterium]
MFRFFPPTFLIIIIVIVIIVITIITIGLFWNWINRNPEITGGFQGLPFAMPKINGKQLVASIQEFNSSIPWRSLTASMMLLDSHDTARFRTVVLGDIAAHKTAMTMMLSYPGVPSIFAGD